MWGEEVRIFLSWQKSLFMQHQMTREEWENIRNYVEKKALELMKHERKNDAVTGVPLENYQVFKINGRVFYAVQTNTFKFIMDELLLKAQLFSPNKFGTGEALDVLQALHSFKTTSFDFASFVNFLSHERCAYILEAENGIVIDRMLRVDLFRLLKMNSKNKHEFVGGVFHALKHFSRNGVNYSLGKGKFEIAHPQDLVEEIVHAFFSLTGVFENSKKYVVLKDYKKYKMKCVFHRESNTEVYFLDTVYVNGR